MKQIDMKRQFKETETVSLKDIDLTSVWKSVETYKDYVKLVRGLCKDTT